MTTAVRFFKGRAAVLSLSFGGSTFVSYFCRLASPASHCRSCSYGITVVRPFEQSNKKSLQVMGQVPGRRFVCSSAFLLDAETAHCLAAPSTFVCIVNVASPLPATLRAVHRLDRHDVALKGVGLEHVSLGSKSVSSKLPMQKDQRTDRDELTAGRESLASPMRSAIAYALRESRLFSRLPKARRRRTPARVQRPKATLLRAFLPTRPNQNTESPRSTRCRDRRWPGACSRATAAQIPAEFKYWKSVELKRRSTKETAKRESNERWTEKKGERDASVASQESGTRALTQRREGGDGERTKGIQTEYGQVVEAKGKEDLHEHLLSESFKRERAKLKDGAW